MKSFFLRLSLSFAAIATLASASWAWDNASNKKAYKQMGTIDPVQEQLRIIEAQKPYQKNDGPPPTDSHEYDDSWQSTDYGKEFMNKTMDAEMSQEAPSAFDGPSVFTSKPAR